MDNLQELHRDIIDANRDLSSLIRLARAIPETPAHSFDDWEKTLRSIEKQVSEEILRVAVVGSVKSGKSTFTNSLFQGDYLKRGAGIITSIVTRVRCGDALKATLYFKSWEEVNDDIDRALALLPPVDPAPGNGRLDIRDGADRSIIEQTLDALGPEALHADGFRNANSVLLSSYMKGYGRVEAIVSSDTLVRRFEGDEFSAHLEFVSEDARAVYLNDVQLEINSGTIERGIEIADCQGCDSPNPLHLAMIQDY
ncbi:MAG: dynamin family protein, partial [Desulfobacterales bacterium]